MCVCKGIGGFDSRHTQFAISYWYNYIDARCVISLFRLQKAPCYWYKYYEWTFVFAHALNLWERISFH